MKLKASPFENQVAERSLVGSLLIEPHRIDETAVAVKPEHFRDDILGGIFAKMCQMRANSVGIDAATVFMELEADNFGQQLTGGTLSLLLELMDSTPTHWHSDYYAKTVFKCWRRRQVASAVETMGNAIKDASTDLDDALGVCDQQLRAAEEAGAAKADIQIGSLLEMALDSKTRTARGLETGFAKLDENINGMRGGQLIVIAARPGVGKSAFVGNISTNLVERGDGVLFVSLEMSQTDVIYRLVARISGLRLWQIRSPEIQYHKPILEAMTYMDRWPLYLDDTVPQTVAQIGSKARSLVRRGKIKLLIVDYLQLLQPSDKRAPREQQVAAMTRDLKVLAKQLNIPIIALSQLNRGVDPSKRPQLSNLRESGAIEQDADVVIFLHRPGMADATSDQHSAEIIVEKHRQGPTGAIEVDWDGTRFQFREKDGVEWK